MRRNRISSRRRLHCQFSGLFWAAMGLSISYDIVTQQHGVTITVDTEVGEYTEFTVLNDGFGAATCRTRHRPAPAVRRRFRPFAGLLRNAPARRSRSIANGSTRASFLHCATTVLRPSIVRTTKITTGQALCPVPKTIHSATTTVTRSGIIVDRRNSFAPRASVIVRFPVMRRALVELPNSRLSSAPLLPWPDQGRVDKVRGLGN